MTKDVIFRDYSMTKPVTGVAMTPLYEQGKWMPSDPIAKYIPEFAHLKVFKGVDADGKMILVDPEHAPTMRELMTHTAGFTYGFFGNTPVDAMYREKQVLGSKNLQEFIDKLAQIPLLYQPGKAWTYSVSMDIQGYIVEKLSGQSLPDFMRDQIFQPLGMKDAGFYVPQEKRNRFATLYQVDPQGETIVGPVPEHSARPRREPPRLRAAEAWPDRGRLLSLARMLAGHGELNGVRVLAPSNAQLMTANHLSPSLLTGEFSIGAAVMRPGFGYGDDCAVSSTRPTQNQVPARPSQRKVPLPSGRLASGGLNSTAQS